MAALSSPPFHYAVLELDDPSTERSSALHDRHRAEPELPAVIYVNGALDAARKAAETAAIECARSGGAKIFAIVQIERVVSAGWAVETRWSAKP